MTDVSYDNNKSMGETIASHPMYKEPKAQECDATGDAIIDTAGIKKIN